MTSKPGDGRRVPCIVHVTQEDPLILPNTEPRDLGKTSFDLKFLRSRFKNMEIKNRLKVISKLLVFFVQTTTVPLKVFDFPYLLNQVFPDCGALLKEAGDLFCDSYRTLPAGSCTPC